MRRVTTFCIDRAFCEELSVRNADLGSKVTYVNTDPARRWCIGSKMQDKVSDVLCGVASASPNTRAGDETYVYTHGLSSSNNLSFTI